MASLDRTVAGSWEIAATFTLYFVALAVSQLFPSLLLGNASFLLYLPAGIKLLSILVFGWRGAVGIALAIFVRLLTKDGTYLVLESLEMALINAGASWMVIYGFLRTFKISSNLYNLNLWHIVGLSAVCSVTNGLLFSLLLVGFNHLGAELYWHKVLMIVLGNFTGNAVLVWLMTYFSRHRLMLQNRLLKFRQH